MFDTIVLLTGSVEKVALSAVLRKHNPRLTIRCVEQPSDLAALDADLLSRARLIGFATPTIVPAQILEQLGFGAYNFHPGPPHYPGWTPAHFAIYDGATDFGATAHVMVAQVDAGPIVGVEMFGVPPLATVPYLEELAYAQLARLFWQLANLLVVPEPLPELPIQWSGLKSSRRLFAALCNITTDISKDELDRRIEALGGGRLDLSPVITLHGHQFRYVAPPAETNVETPSIVPAKQTVELV